MYVYTGTIPGTCGACKKKLRSFRSSKTNVCVESIILPENARISYIAQNAADAWPVRCYSPPPLEGTKSIWLLCHISIDKIEYPMADMSHNPVYASSVIGLNQRVALKAART
jgi:hypothetical protein